MPTLEKVPQDMTRTKPKKNLRYGSDQSSLKLYDEFLAHTNADRLQKILARYELFKMTLDIPGDIVECGVFKGTGIYTLAKLHKLLCPNNERRIVGFDFFDTERKIKFRHQVDAEILNDHKPEFSNRKAILSNLARMGITNVDLITGDVIKTTEKYVKDNPGFRISFLYLDVDNYEGTIAILKNFYPLVSIGGVIVFDEYARRKFGESDAVDEYFKRMPVNIKSLSWANTPTAYIIKENYGPPL